MKLAIVTGYFALAPERERAIVEGYIRTCEPPATDIMTHHVSARSRSNECVKNNEISALITSARPDVLIDIHSNPHMYCTQRLEKLKRNIVGVEQLMKQEHGLSSSSERRVREELRRMLDIFEYPVQVLFVNSEINSPFEIYLKAQRDLCNYMMIPTEARRTILEKSPPMTLAQSQRIPYVMLFNHLLAVDGTIVKDDSERETFRRTIGLLERIQQYSPIRE